MGRTCKDDRGAQRVSKWWGSRLTVRATGAGHSVQKEEGQFDGGAASRDAGRLARMDKLQGPNQQHVDDVI